MNALYFIITLSKKWLPCAASLLALLLLYGCSTYSPPYPSYPPPLPPPAPPHSEPAPQGALPSPPAHVPQYGPARTLYQGALNDLGRGNYQKAELQLERALRIEPKNSHYWYTLALVKYSLQQYSQAIQFCLKSKSLAGNDLTLIRSNNGLIERSRRQLSR